MRLIGREGELARLEEALRAAGRSGATVALAGEAGMGKSRLAEELVARARALGRALLVAGARRSDAGVPLGPFRDALRARRRGRHEAPPSADPLAAAFPGMVLPELGAGGPVERDLLFEAATRHLAALAAPAGLVLVLEDLHHADPASCALAAHLARTLRERPVLLLLTYRPEEAPPALDELRMELVRERLGAELTLGPLGAGEVAALVEAVVGRPLADAAASVLARRTGGNPFLVRELARAALEEGAPDARTGAWPDIGEPPLPWAVQEAVASRARRLDAAAQELLRWAAVAGERFSLEGVAAAAGLRPEAAGAAMARCRRAGLVADEPGSGRLAFRPPLAREALAEEMVAPERRRRAARLLAVAEAASAGAGDAGAGELAELAAAAGERARACAHAARAGAWAAASRSPREAEAQLRRALALWEPAAGDSLRAGLLLDLGRLLLAAGDRPAAAPVLAEAREALAALGDRTGAAVALALGADARWDALDRDGVEEDLAQALGSLGPDAPADARRACLAAAARVRAASGRPAAAMAAAAEALALVPEGARGARDRLELDITRGAALAAGGEARGAARELGAALRRARAIGDGPATARALLELAAGRRGEPAAAAAHVEAALAAAREHGLRRTELRALWLRAAVHVEAGEFEAADAAADAADQSLAAVGADEMAGLGLRVVRAMRARRAGALEQAIEGFAAAAVDAEAVSAWERAWEARVGLARARLASGDPAGAREALAPALERWESGPEGPTPAWVALAQTGLEAAIGLGDADEAARLAGLTARLAPGPLADYAEALLALGRGLRPQPGRLESAAAALERAGARPEAARMRMVGAEALARLPGGEDEAAELAAQALRGHREMGGEDWARRAEGLLRRLGRRAPTRRVGALREGLTPREVEVLGLVAEGLSNRAVADRLVISEATAARHVFNLFGKLGVHTRAQAARIYAERGLGREPEAAGSASSTHPAAPASTDPTMA